MRRLKYQAKLQYPNPKYQTNPKSQMPKFQTSKFWSLVIWSLVIIWNLVLGIWNSTYLYARDNIVAIVNDEIVTQKDLNDFINFTRIQLSKEATQVQVEKSLQSMIPQMLDKLIEDRLILQDAKKNDYKVEVAPKRFYSIKPDESRVKARLNEIKKRYPSDAEFQKDLSSQGLVQADIESKIREQLLMYNIIEFKIRSKILVSPEEVTSFYKENPKEFISSEMRQVEVLILESLDYAKTVSYELKRSANLADLAKIYPFTIENME